MGKPEAVTAAIDAETLADLKRLAAHMDCSIDHLVTTAVLRFVNEEIGAITPDEFAHIPPYRDQSPTGQALDEAEDRAAEALEAFLKVGEDDLTAGRVHTQEEVETMFNVRRDKRRAA